MSMMGETYGWRGKIGFICPGGEWCGCNEYYPLLPEGVALDVTTLGVDKMSPNAFESIFGMYLPAAKRLEAAECDVIVAGGAAPFNYLGYSRVQEELMRKLREDISVPVTMSLDAHFDALRALKAKKIVIVTPYEDARNKERKELCESVGFEVLAIKGLGIGRKLDIEKLPHYTSYKLAMAAFREAPEADAIYISCPIWPTVRHIEKLEQDTGIPVVADVAAVIWAALRAMHLKIAIRGFGRLLEQL